MYRADDPELVADALRAARLTHRINGTAPDEEELRRSLLAALLGEIGPGTVIRPPFHCDYGFPTRVGARTFVNVGAVVLDCAPVTIGSDVQIGPGVQLLTATHPLDPDARRSGDEYALPIVVEDGAWLGGGVIVCPGVRIGVGSVVGAGSVVTRNIPQGVISAGNPCRVRRPVPERL